MVLGEREYYLRRVPAAIQDGSIEFAASGTRSVWYQQLDVGRGYEITVRIDGREPCAMRGGSTIGASTLDECASR